MFFQVVIKDMPLNLQEKKALLLNLFRIACSRSEETATDAFSHILDANVFPELATGGAETPKSDDSASGAVAANHIITLDTDTGVRTFHHDPLNTAIDLVISEEDGDDADDGTLSHITGSVNHVEAAADKEAEEEEAEDGEEEDAEGAEEEDAEDEEEDAEGAEDEDAEGEEEDAEDEEEDAEGEEEEEEGLEVETIKINKIYYWKDVNSDDVYTCVPPDDDVGDKVGTYKNGKFTRC